MTPSEVDELFADQKRPKNRVTFHNPFNDRFYNITGALNIAPEGVSNEQQLYNKLESVEQYLLSFMTHDDVDVHELDKHIQFTYQLKKAAARITSCSYAIGFRKVRA